jgi:hypothetical protein
LLPFRPIERRHSELPCLVTRQIIRRIFPVNDYGVTTFTLFLINIQSTPGL